MHRHRITVVEGVLDANDTIAAANRADFDAAGVTVVNLMSSPGSGKTMLLERLAGMLDGVRLGVIEGDVQGSYDGDRIAHLHLPVVQINTASGFGGECHLDANMVRSALSAMPLEELDVLIVENVGNLVCPAEFRIGEHARAMVISITEGEDKPLKYPLMFHAADVVVINKMDLLEHLDFDLDLLAANIAAVNPHAEQFRVSARSGEGVEALRDWLAELPARYLAHGQHV
jgi:hydrogenase nickel incorporation protein HypB